MITQIQQSGFGANKTSPLTIMVIVNEDRRSIERARSFVAKSFINNESVDICTCPVTALIRIETESLDVLLVDNDFEHLNSSYILGYMKEERQMYRDTLCLQLDNGKAPSSLKTIIAPVSTLSRMDPCVVKSSKKAHLTLVK